MKPVFLATDLCIYLLLVIILALAYVSCRKIHLRRIWAKVFQSKLAVAAAMMLMLFFSIALLDSIHFRESLPATSNGLMHYSTKVKSLLDVILAPRGVKYESTYSKPLALHAFVKSNVRQMDGRVVRKYETLKHAGKNLKAQQRTQTQDLWYKILQGVFWALVCWLAIFIVYRLIYDLVKYKKLTLSLKFEPNYGGFSHSFFFGFLLCMMLLIFITYQLSQNYHILGTTKIGLDVFYEAMKSVRTGVLIGTITTLFMLPLAIAFGIAAGYYGGLIDDIIQYIYTTLSSIPGVLLIAASILSLQIFISNHPDLFGSLIERADARLLALCLILGVTSWTGLCRLLRAESLKVREYDFVMAARSLGVSNVRIILRHILPNVLHIIIISIVLDFSGLVLAEAVLSYVGVGVDPSMMSWGNMINSARLELARSPSVWWPLLTAFVFMFALVLSANVFAERVREAFDPRVNS